MAVIHREGKYTDEVLLKVQDRAYSVRSVRVQNPQASPITEVLGLTVTNATPAVAIVAGQEASAAGVVIGVPFFRPNSGDLGSHTIPASSTSAQEFLVLYRGPAIVKRQGLISKDATGADLNINNIVTALRALNVPIEVQDGPVVTATQLI